jgi:hypothetical protein
MGDQHVAGQGALQRETVDLHDAGLAMIPANHDVVWRIPVDFEIEFRHGRGSGIEADIDEEVQFLGDEPGIDRGDPADCPATQRGGECDRGHMLNDVRGDLTVDRHLEGGRTSWLQDGDEMAGGFRHPSEATQFRCMEGRSWQVHRVGHDLTAQRSQRGGGDDLTDRFQGLTARSADVRSEDDIGEAEEGALVGRLLGEDIDSSRCQMAALQRLGQCLHIDHLPARAVDHDGSRLHARDRPGIEHVARFWRRGNVERHDVAVFQKRLVVDRFHAELREALAGDVRVIAEKSALECPESLRHDRTDAPEADDSDRLPLEIEGAKALAFPPSRVRRRVGVDQVARDGQHEGDGMFAR